MSFAQSSCLFLLFFILLLISLAFLITLSIKGKWILASTALTTLAVFATLSSYFAHYRFEPKNLIRNYMEIRLSDDVRVHKYHANIFTRDGSYMIHMTVSSKDAEQIVSFFKNQKNQLGRALERAPESWKHPDEIDNLDAYLTRRGSVWFELDVNKATGEMWLSIRST